MNNDHISIIKGNKDKCQFIIKWNRGSNCFTIESTEEDCVVIYKDSINDLISEIEKIKELMEETKSNIVRNKQ